MFIFQAVRGVKGQKIAQNEECQLHSLHVISQEQYSLWSWFLVHLCKMMRCPGPFSFFLFFLIASFFWVVRVKAQKMYQDGTLSVALHVSGTIYHMIVIYGIYVTFLSNDISRIFFHFFQNFDYLGCDVRGRGG